MHEKLLQLADALRNDRRQVNGSFDFVACVNEHAKRLYGQDFPAPDAKGQFIAPELAEKQTLENLQAFSDRLHRYHTILKESGSCRCKSTE